MHTKKEWKDRSFQALLVTTCWITERRSGSYSTWAVHSAGTDTNIRQSQPRVANVNNHACIFLGIKNKLGIQKKVFTENDRCPEAAAGQNHRTVSCLQDRLHIGGPKTGDSPFPQYSTTPVYYSEILLLPITPEIPPTTTTTIPVTEVVFACRAKNFEKYRFMLCWTCSYRCKKHKSGRGPCKNHGKNVEKCGNNTG
jgi:hypothetical protein